MNRFDQLSRLSIAISVAVGVAVTSALRAPLQALNLPHWVPIVVDIFIMTAFATVLRQVVENWLFSSSVVRRLLLGQQYVEGTWINIVTRDSETAPSIGLVQIEAHDNSLLYKGFNYNLGGGNTGCFTTEMVTMAWPKLSFKYNSRDKQEAATFSQGFGELQFESQHAGGASNHFSGLCIDFVQGRHFIEGWKVTSRKDRKLLKNPTTMRSCLLRLAAQYFQEVGAADSRIQRDDNVERDGPEQIPGS